MKAAVYPRFSTPNKSRKKSTGLRPLSKPPGLPETIRDKRKENFM